MGPLGQHSRVTDVNPTVTVRVVRRVILGRNSRMTDAKGIGLWGHGACVQGAFALSHRLEHSRRKVSLYKCWTVEGADVGLAVIWCRRGEWCRACPYLIFGMRSDDGQRYRASTPRLELSMMGLQSIVSVDWLKLAARILRSRPRGPMCSQRVFKDDSRRVTLAIALRLDTVVARGALFTALDSAATTCYGTVSRCRCCCC